MMLCCGTYGAITPSSRGPWGDIQQLEVLISLKNEIPAKHFCNGERVNYKFTYSPFRWGWLQSLQRAQKHLLTCINRIIPTEEEGKCLDTLKLLTSHWRICVWGNKQQFQKFNSCFKLDLHKQIKQLALPAASLMLVFSHLHLTMFR